MPLLNVQKKSPMFESIEVQWQTVYDLLDINRIKGAGETYLLKHRAEEDKDYIKRLQQATFFDYFKRNLINATSVITRNDVNFSQLSERQETFFLNVDLENRDINSFVEDTVFSSLAYGIHYVLVDHTNLIENVSQGRPYWVDIPARNVISLKTKRIEDKEQLVEFRFKETITGSEDFNYSTNIHDLDDNEVDQIRRYFVEDDVVHWEVYRKDSSKNYSLYDEGIMKNTPIIPIVPFYGGMRESFYFSKPPFYSLGTTEIRLYNSYSEQVNNLTTTRLPILVAKNYTSYDEDGNKTELKLSPHSVVLGDNDLEISYIETSGSALEQGWKDIEKLKEIIIDMGIGLQPSAIAGDMTATAKVIETAQQHAFLKKVARRFEDTLIQLISLTAYMDGDTNIPDVIIDISITEDLGANNGRNESRDNTQNKRPNSQFEGDTGTQDAIGDVEEN